MSQRLTLAVETGTFAVPEDGRILVLHPTDQHDLSALPQARVTIVQPLKSEFDALQARGWHVLAECPEKDQFAAAVVFVTRAKALTRQLVAQAVSRTTGKVLLDGAKTDGIDSLMTALKKEPSPSALPSAALSKAHGKAFWIKGGFDLSHWLSEENATADGWHTAPGVFSADAVDPASALLVEALPSKLGKRVVDLGAGWGVLSAAILERDGVETVDLVEVNHVALSCAQKNIEDSRARFHWADARRWGGQPHYDTVVMNPPFHTGRSAEPALGQAFILNAVRILSPAGKLWMVANRHLPYEATLEASFGHVEERAGDNRFKVLLAERPKRRR